MWPLVYLLFFLVTSSYLCQPLFDASIYLNLTVGRWIAAQTAIPSTDLWTIAGQGLEWSPSSWTFDWLTNSIESLYGFQALTAFKAILIFAVSLSLQHCYSTAGATRFVASFFATLVSVGLFVTYSLSPDIVAWLCVPWFLISVHKFNAAPNVKRAATLLLVSVCYSNLHVNYLLAAVFAIVVVVLSKREVVENLRSAAIASTVFTLAAFATFSPHRLSSLYLCTVNELRVALSGAFGLAQLFRYDLAIFLILSCLLIAQSFSASTRINLGEWLVLIFLGATAFISIDYLPYASIFVGYLCARSFAPGNVSRESNLSTGLSLLEARFKGFAARGSAGLVFFLGALVFINVVSLWNTPAYDIVPQHELDYALEHQELFPILHQPKIGDYLVYRLSDAAGVPQRKALFDGRLNAFSHELGASAAMMQFGKFDKDFLERFKPRSVLTMKKDGLFHALSLDAKWHRLVVAGRSAEEDSKAGDVSGLEWVVFKRVEQVPELY